MALVTYCEAVQRFEAAANGGGVTLGGGAVTSVQIQSLPVAAPTTVDCAGDWGGWEDCSAGCGGGTQARSYAVAAQPANGGVACPSDSPQLRPCNPLPCVATTPAQPECEPRCHQAHQLVTNSGMFGALCGAGPGS